MSHHIINWCFKSGVILPGVYAEGRRWIAAWAVGWDWHGFQEGTPSAKRHSRSYVDTKVDGKFTVTLGPFSTTKLPWIHFDIYGNGKSVEHYG